MATNYLSNKAKYLLATGGINLSSDTLKMMLVTSSYTPDPDNNFVSSAAAAEISTTNYTGGYGGSGRKTLTSLSVTQVDASNLAKFTATIPVWSALGPATSGPAIAYALLIRNTGSTSDSDQVVVATFDCAIQTNGGDLTLTAAAGGLITLS